MKNRSAKQAFFFLEACVGLFILTSCLLLLLEGYHTLFLYQEQMSEKQALSQTLYEHSLRQQMMDTSEMTVSKTRAYIKKGALVLEIYEK